MDPFLGEIRILPFNFAPYGWAFCNGQLMSIAQNSALFSLLGTTFGGDGIQTFALPNFQGRFPMHWGQGVGLTYRALGEAGGNELVTMNTLQMPQHTHSVTPMASSGLATQTAPNGGVLAAGLGSKEARFANESGDVQMAAFNSGSTGNNQPLPIMNPFLAISFCIALQGIFPARN